MGRARTITNEQILEAAREVFLAEGFGASTLEIARKAGISEASIFKRFSTKENLFFAAMGISSTPKWVQDLETLSGKGDLKENLTEISLKIIEFSCEMLPRIMMVAAKGNLPPMQVVMNIDRSASIEDFSSEPKNADSTTSAHLVGIPGVRDLKALTRFFERELELGRIRSCNPEVLAYTLKGSLMHYVFMEYTTGANHASIGIPAYIRAVIDVLWQGIAPE